MLVGVFYRWAACLTPTALRSRECEAEVARQMAEDEHTQRAMSAFKAIDVDDNRRIPHEHS